VGALKENADALHFVNEAYKHCKPIATEGEGVEFLKVSYWGSKLLTGDTADKSLSDKGVIINGKSEDFIKAISQHRFWERENKDNVPA
jgi:catalase